MQAVYRIIESAAASKATVFITGETGTGKEVCAEAIHGSSSRSRGPFIALNCAAIPSDLMESEIFGHVKGAFTGALRDREGAAAMADGGTLFLDEICEMPLDLQSKLLRFLQTQQFTKVGGSKVQHVDVRFVCATNRHPQEEVAQGRFREDLYYRLHVIPIELPALRDRDDDVLTLAEHFLEQYAREEGKTFEGLAPEAAEKLLAYSWPGNVRELQNVIRKAVVLSTTDGQLSADWLPIEAAKPSIQAPEPEPGKAQDPAPKRAGADQTAGGDTGTGALALKPLRVMEKELIEEAIRQAGGNIPRAAAMIEVSPSTVYRKLAQWERESEAPG
jgi:two-component system repressor protein LuxO